VGVLRNLVSIRLHSYRGPPFAGCIHPA
jgi:hypothetical protein